MKKIKYMHLTIFQKNSNSFKGKGKYEGKLFFIFYFYDHFTFYYNGWRGGCFEFWKVFEK